MLVVEKVQKVSNQNFTGQKSPADNLSLQRRRDWARLFARLDEIYCTCDSLFADQTL